MDGKVAVITRTKNRPLLLKRALDSVIGQTFGDWVHVIVNDGGERAAVDNLVAALADRYAGRCHVLHNDASRGMEAASNQGLAASTSRFVVIHDDDDAWHPDFLGKTVDYLEANAAFPKLGGVISHTELVVETIQDERIETLQRRDFNCDVENVHLFRMLAQNMFPPISFLFARDALAHVGPFREDLPVLGDWEFNVRFLQAFEIGVISQRLAYYHHRRQGDAEDYKNSVIGQNGHHLNYSAFLRNEWLRHDLEKGGVGIGAWANISWQIFQLEGRLKSRPPKKKSLFRRIFG